MRRRRGTAKLALVPACLLGALMAPLAGAAPAIPAEAAAPGMPPIGHVWVINLENENLSSTFQDPTDNPYMAGTLPAMGALLTQYYGIGHNSLDNYVAEISGQAPNNDTEGDCVSGDWTPSNPPLDPNGQAIGQGCVFPSNVLTIADQLDPHHTDMRGVTWKGYMEDMGVDAFNDAGIRCAHYPSSATSGGSGGADPADKYVQKHNPFVYFHSLIDEPGYCEVHDAPLGDLHTDLQSVATTPKYSMITAGLQNDGHDSSAGAVEFGITADRWLREVIPMILASPAYRQDGMIVLTSDEGVLVTTGSGAASTGSACCNEQPGPNYPIPGGDTGGPGGGDVGAVILSPFVKPGTVVSPDPGPAGCTPATCNGPGYYNHYSLLRTVEDIFHTTGGTDGSGHLGFAGSSATYAGPGEFGCEVFTAYAPCQSGSPPAQPAASAPASGSSTGPRAADGSSTWLNPGPQGDDLAAVDCSVATTCVAAGHTGTILRSTDAGATWARQPSGSAMDLNGLSCLGSGACLAVGSQGTVLHSADGGSTWTGSTAGAAGGHTLNAVTCRADGLCLAVGDAGTLLRSTDGGSTWQSEPTNTSDPLSGVACVPGAAIASTTCIAAGTFDFLNNHNALRSSDGGATWTQIAIGTVMHRLRAISCATATLCFTAGDAGYVAWSTDGATTWQDTGNPIDNSDAYLGASCSNTTATFACFAVGEHYHTSASSAGGNDPWGAVVLASTDGGQTFVPSWPGTSQSLLAASCNAAQACVSVGARGTIMRSTDGGKTWQLQTAGAESPISQVSCPPRVLASDGHTYQMSPVCQRDSFNSLRAIACPAPQTCYAAGDNGTVISTADGFAHWAVRAADSNPPSSTPTSKPVSLSGIACPSTTRCVAVGSYGTILATTDGTAWKAQTSPTTETLRAVSCTAVGACVATGDHGVILASPDGTTWTAVASPVEVTLNGVSCPASGLCVAVGTGGAVVTGAVSGAAAWTLQSPPTGLSLSAVSCASATTCTAVGSGGAAITTGDGGVHWTQRSTTVGDQLDGVSCLSAGVCVATGSQGTQVDTGNGGSSWGVRGTGTDRELLAVACPTATCYEVGEAGAILSTTAPSPSAPALSITVTLQPSSIPADGVSTTTAVATVLDAGGHGLAGQTVSFSRSGSGVIAPDPATDNGDGTYTTRLIASLTPGAETVTASTGGSSGSAVLTETPLPVGPGFPPPQGYWTVASDGGVFSFGSAAFYNSMGGQHLNAPIVGMARTPSGNGYWLVASDGGVFAFGDAGFYKSMGGTHLNAPVVGMAATPSGNGYWLVASDGGIFSFGDAGFHGSTGNLHLNAPVVGIARTPTGNGYWMVASDGGIFTFGDAGFYQSMGGTRLNAPMVGMAPTEDGRGYWLVARDGGIFSFGDAGFHQSMGGTRLNAPMVGMAGLG